VAKTAQPSLPHASTLPQMAMDVDRRRVIGQPRFRREAERLLERLGSQEGPITHDDLVESRTSPPDPELAGSPEPVRVRTDVLLPLPGRPVRVRLYRDAPATPRPLLLWLHGGGFVGGSLDLAADPVDSRDQWYRWQYLAGQAVTPHAAPLTAPDLSGLPPALILGAGLDPLVDDARRYARRLEDAGVAVSYLEYADTPHAFLNFPGVLAAAWTAMQDVAGDLTAFLSR
jgi:acetyl esterase/lipase